MTFPTTLQPLDFNGNPVSETFALDSSGSTASEVWYENASGQQCLKFLKDSNGDWTFYTFPPAGGNNIDPTIWKTSMTVGNAFTRTDGTYVLSDNEYIFMYRADPTADFIGYFQFDASWTFTASGGGGGFLSTNPKIENVAFTKTSDSSFNLSFYWENLSSYTVTNSRNGVVQTASANLSGSTGTENGHISLSCQDGDLLWVHGNTNYHHTELGSVGNPFIFRLVDFSISGTTS